jgi:hypothetical protein
MRGHVPGIGQLAGRRSGMFDQPLSKLASCRVLFSRKGEVHLAKRRLYG